MESIGAELLGRQDVQEMVDTIKKTHPALVDDLIPSKVPLATLHRVLQRLLRERVPIRDLITILEAVGDAADTTKDPEQLTEHARRALGNVIAQQYAEADGTVRGVTLGPRLEAALMSLFTPRAAQSGQTMITPNTLANLLRELQTLTATSPDARPLPLIVPPGLRIGIRRFVEPVLPALPVLSLAELPPYVNLNTTAMWEMQHAA